jgi:Ca-activated chloride channel family protein
MSFIWPPLLLLLLLIPLGVAIYRRRESRRAARAAALGWGPAAAGAAAAAGANATAGGQSSSRPRRRWVRGLPAVLTVAGMTILVLSLARPQSVIGVPRLEGTVMLAFDISGSMAATDVSPSRMEQAKTAAMSFLQAAPSSLRVGVVAFSDGGLSTQIPTFEREPVAAAIERLEPARGTSLGQGILTSLKAIDLAEHPPGKDYYAERSPAPTPEPTPFPDGFHEPIVIVLFSDGENTVRPDPTQAIQTAHDRGIRIDTVGLGTTAGATLDLDGFRVHTSLDEDVLKQIADGTGGTYHAASDQDAVSRIGDDVGSRLVVKDEPMELTSLFALAGSALLVAGGLGSLRWFGRLP